MNRIFTMTSLVALASLALTPASAEAADPGHVTTFQATQRCAGCDLSQGQFAQGVFTVLDVRDSDVRGADFGASRHAHSYFVRSDLTAASFAGADLRYVSFTDSNLTGVDLTGATLLEVSLAGARLDGARWIDGRTCSPQSLERCELLGDDWWENVVALDREQQRDAMAISAQVTRLETLGAEVGQRVSDVVSGNPPFMYRVVAASRQAVARLPGVRARARDLPGMSSDITQLEPFARFLATRQNWVNRRRALAHSLEEVGLSNIAYYATSPTYQAGVVCGEGPCDFEGIASRVREMETILRELRRSEAIVG